MFTVRLPLDRSVHPDRKRRIFIIEDHADLRQVLEKSLQDEGFEVATACNGNEALRILRHFTADVMVTDIFMPDKDGIETISELKRRYPGLKIIAMSGGPTRAGQVDYLALIRDIGADRALRKPFLPSELIDIIRKLQP